MHTPHFDNISAVSFYLTLIQIVSNRVNIIKHPQGNEKGERKISNRNKKKRSRNEIPMHAI
jgi:hypothetical protein